MRVLTTDTEVTVIEYTPQEIEGIKRQLEANNMEYTEENGRLTVDKQIYSET